MIVISRFSCDGGRQLSLGNKSGCAEGTETTAEATDFFQK